MWTRDQLIARVQARIDESGGQAAVLSTDVIGQELDDAAKAVLLAAPLSAVYPAATRITDNSYVNMDGTDPLSVLIPLPETFLRFVRVRLDNWKRSLDSTIEADSPEYGRQAYYYDRATAWRPVAAIVPLNYESKTRAIECFPAPPVLNPGYDVIQYADVAPEDGIYVPPRKVTVKNTGITGNRPPIVSECLILTELPAESVPSLLADAVLWLAASRCLTALRVQEGAKNTMAQFQLAMPGRGSANG